jgi:16S rRNA (guanine527-N7)-methyltransferase
VFGPRLALAEQYAELLRTTGTEWGLIGPREAPRIWTRHLLNCAVVAPALPPEAFVVDLGSGAGLPGIVLALARPDLRVVLVEPLQRRVDFLDQAVHLLDLFPQVEVRRARAEELAGVITADVVTARALAPLDHLAGLALPLVVPDGLLLALKGARAAEELAAAENTLRRLGAASWVLERWGGTMLDQPTTVIRIIAGGQAPPVRQHQQRGPVR